MSPKIGLIVEESSRENGYFYRVVAEDGTFYSLKGNQIKDTGGALRKRGSVVKLTYVKGGSWALWFASPMEEGD